VLGAHSRPERDRELKTCEFWPRVPEQLLYRGPLVGTIRGPTDGFFVEIDYSVLANGLRGNSRLKILSLFISGNLKAGKTELLTTAGGAPRKQRSR
jgi:hypothetical protein